MGTFFVAALPICDTVIASECALAKVPVERDLH